MLNVIINIDYYFYRLYRHLGDNSFCLSVKGWLDWVSSGRPKKDYACQLNWAGSINPRLKFWTTKGER